MRGLLRYRLLSSFEYQALTSPVHHPGLSLALKESCNDDNEPAQETASGENATTIHVPLQLMHGTAI
jgi:hypothetical protein